MALRWAAYAIRAAPFEHRPDTDDASRQCQPSIGGAPCPNTSLVTTRFARLHETPRTRM
jgi:hypothetical protein